MLAAPTRIPPVIDMIAKLKEIKHKKEALGDRLLQMIHYL
jgi:hypothetical protein